MTKFDATHSLSKIRERAKFFCYKSKMIISNQRIRSKIFFQKNWEELQETDFSNISSFSPIFDYDR